MSELTHSFLSVHVSVSIFMALSTLFHSINSPNNSVLSLCSAGLISALLLLSTVYFFMKVFFSPDVILGCWLGSKYQLSNYLTMIVMGNYFLRVFLLSIPTPFLQTLSLGTTRFIHLFSSNVSTLLMGRWKYSGLLSHNCKWYTEI